MGCCVETFRKYALLFFVLFTICFSFLVAISICGYQSKIILTAAGLTLLLVFALTIFACNIINKLGKISPDLTGCGPYILVFSLILLAFGIVSIFWRDPIVQLIYSCLAAVMMSIYLIFDTQLILGNNQYSYTLDDSYLAAIQLYIDIIQLFLNLLRILSYVDR
jgi:FtsH-binding integral membrane protein